MVQRALQWEGEICSGREGGPAVGPAAPVAMPGVFLGWGWVYLGWVCVCVCAVCVGWVWLGWVFFWVRAWFSWGCVCLYCLGCVFFWVLDGGAWTGCMCMLGEQRQEVFERSAVGERELLQMELCP